jgi:hypothetical protein
MLCQHSPTVSFQTRRVSVQSSRSAAGGMDWARAAFDAKPSVRAHATARLSCFLLNEFFMVSLDE